MTTILHNRDMHIPPEMVAQFPDLANLLNNPEVYKDFERADEVGNQSKRLFNALGLSSLIFIVVVLLVVTWRFFSHTQGVAVPNWLLWISAGLGFLAFSLALSSHFIFEFHDKWLQHRFITERLRQWNFQQLLDGSFAAMMKTDPIKFEAELKARWIRAKYDLLGKPGALDDFVNAEAFELWVTPSVCPDTTLADQIFEAYRLFRLEYQTTYFTFKKATLRTIDIWTNSFAKISLMVAGMLALAEIILLLAQSGSNESSLSWMMGAAALSMALLSAAIRVVRSAKAISEETERYASKWVVLKILAQRFRLDSDPSKRLECMIETERVSVEELREFLRSFAKSDYLL